jgi:hypothetical protein
MAPWSGFDISPEEIAESKVGRAVDWMSRRTTINHDMVNWRCYSDAEHKHLIDNRAKLKGFTTWTMFKPARLKVDYLRDHDSQFIFTFAEKMAGFNPRGRWTAHRADITSINYLFRHDEDAVLFQMIMS